MGIVYINEIIIDLSDLHLSEYKLKSSDNFTITFEQKTDSAKTMFIGFPDNTTGVKNFRHCDISKFRNKLHQGYAIAIMYKILESLKNYNQFIILTVAMDYSNIYVLSIMAEALKATGNKMVLLTMSMPEDFPIFKIKQ